MPNIRKCNDSDYEDPPASEGEEDDEDKEEKAVRNRPSSIACMPIPRPSFVKHSFQLQENYGMMQTSGA